MLTQAVNVLEPHVSGIEAVVFRPSTRSHAPQRQHAKTRLNAVLGAGMQPVGVGVVSDSFDVDCIAHSTSCTLYTEENTKAQDPGGSDEIG